MNLKRAALWPLILVATAVVATAIPYWYIWTPKGTHVPEGPGAGQPGAIVTSPTETAMAGNLSAIWSSLTNLTSSMNDLMGPDGDHDKQQKVIMQALGQRAAGEDLGAIKPDIDPVSLVRRKQMLEELKNSPDAPKYAHFIAYFETMQAHEARDLLFVQRANILIKANSKPMNWQERIRLAAEIGILNAQQTAAQMDATEAYNRAVIQASLARLADAIREKREIDTRHMAETMTVER